MNIYNLMEYKGIDIKEIHGFFCENRYNELYSDYMTVINDLLFITSKDEFDDFMEQTGEIEEEAFLLALAFEKGLCSSFGIYEENVGDILQQYFSQNENRVEIDCKELNQNSEMLTDCVKEVNNRIMSYQRKYIILLDGTYCEGCYYIFEISDSEDDGVWESNCIEKVL